MMHLLFFGSTRTSRLPFTHAVEPSCANAKGGNLLVLTNATYRIPERHFEALFPGRDTAELKEKIHQNPLHGQETPGKWLRRLKATPTYSKLRPILEMWGGCITHANANRHVEDEALGHQRRAKPQDMLDLFSGLQADDRMPDAVLTVGTPARLAAEKTLKYLNLHIPVVSINHTGGRVSTHERTCAAREIMEIFDVVKQASGENPSLTVLPTWSRITYKKAEGNNPTRITIRVRKSPTLSQPGINGLELNKEKLEQLLNEIKNPPTSTSQPSKRSPRPKTKVKKASRNLSPETLHAKTSKKPTPTQAKKQKTVGKKTFRAMA